MRIHRRISHRQSALRGILIVEIGGPAMKEGVREAGVGRDGFTAGPTTLPLRRRLHSEGLMETFMRGYTGNRPHAGIGG
jgi:hypothetical protein